MWEVDQITYPPSLAKLHQLNEVGRIGYYATSAMSHLGSGRPADEIDLKATRDFIDWALIDLEATTDLGVEAMMRRYRYGRPHYGAEEIVRRLRQGDPTVDPLTLVGQLRIATHRLKDTNEAVTVPEARALYELIAPLSTTYIELAAITAQSGHC